MSTTLNHQRGKRNDKNVSPTTANDAAPASPYADLYTYIIWTTAASAARTCEKIYCPCALIAIDESLKYIVETDAEGYVELLSSIFAHTNEED